MFELMNCLFWTKTRKVLGVTVCKEGKLSAPGIPLGSLSNRVVNRWNVISGQSMHLAGMHSRMAYLGLATTEWASSRTRTAKP